MGLMRANRMRTAMAFTKIGLSILLATQTCFQSAYAETTPRSNPKPTNLQISEQSNQETDPIWKKFAEAKATGFNLKYDANDPAIDQDPFFMRSQKWATQNKKTTKLSYAKSENALAINVPNSSKMLVLNLPLNPIQSTTDFIFLSLDSTSDIFKKANGLSPEASEGIFFINRKDLAVQASEGKPAPIFFFPLAGSGWTEKLNSIEISQANMLVVSNKTDSVAIELQDVESLMKAEQINLMVAMALTIKNRGANTENILPAPGTTAGFGMFFTGIDLQMPNKSMWEAGVNTSASNLPATHYLFTSLAHKVSQYFPLLVRPAQASGVFSPELISRLVFVGSVLTAMLVTSVVIKYSHPGVRKKIADLRAESEPPTSKLKIVKREIKETFDVFASITSTSAQISSVTFANALELFLDRFAPSVAAAEHGLVRRFLKNTFYFSRNSMKNVPVNSRTFVLGAIVMGGVDTAMVAIQYQAAVPMIAEAVAPHVDTGTQARIEQTFDPSNPNTKQIALQDTVRTGISYLLSGASSYSMDARAQVIDTVTKEVEAEMKAQGIDPEDPKNQSKKQRRIDDRINVTMKQKGLPDQSKFLFDANSLFSKLAKSLGYKTPEAMQAKESFILENRFGLSANALKKAISSAQEWNKTDSSDAAKDALSLLQETLQNMKLLKNGLTNGLAGIRAAQDVRQQLTLLSYEGSIEYAVKYIPEAWSKKYSAVAAQAAALMFRQALYTYLSKEGDALVFAKNDKMEEYGKLAKERALEGIKAETGLTEADIAKNADLGFELKLRTQIEINNIAKEEIAKKDADSFKPEKLDWLARKKQQRALLETDARMADYLKTSAGIGASDSDLMEVKKNIFKDALARQVGLHIEDIDVAKAQGREDYVRMMEQVELKSSQAAEAEITTNLDMARYLEKQSEAERVKMKLFIYANNFLQNYKEATTELEMVKPTDPAQPGRFQKLRQTEFVRNSKFLTRTLRTFESFGDDTSMKLGWKGSLARNFPLGADLMNTHIRMGKTALSALTVSYLWSFYAWQTHIPFGAWTLLVATSAATISTPSMWLNKVFRLNGLKAMDSIASKIAYTIPYAWVTFAGMFPIMLYSADVTALFSDFVRSPVMSLLNHIQLKEFLSVALGLGLITAFVKRKFRSDFSGKSEKVTDLVKPRAGRAIKLNCSALFTK